MRISQEYWVPLRTRALHPRTWRPFLRGLYECAASMMMASLLVFGLFTFAGKPVCVAGDSMKPTLHNGEWLFVSSLNPRLHRGRIVVIAEGEELRKPIVKRLIALPGDTVDIDFDKGEVIVNGSILREPYVAGPTTRSADVTFPVTVPQGKCFVLGDNRGDSLDSRFRSVGMVEINKVVGEAQARILPLRQWKKLNAGF
ncbi:MAG: signal peptidase I [Oscillospiraceae bacterium]|jgi:signal peptidase I|nr:signal peptidase I [Oscillospiraceae bacterium]